MSVEMFAIIVNFLTACIYAALTVMAETKGFRLVALFCTTLWVGCGVMAVINYNQSKHWRKK